MSEPSAASVLAALDPDTAGVTSASLYATLVQTRTLHIKKEDLLEALIEDGLLAKLIKLLARPNSRVVDVTLSILGNLMMKSTARKKIRAERDMGGVAALVGVLSTLAEESILCRAARTVANMAQDPVLSKALHDRDILQVVLKVLGDAKQAKLRQVIIRALKILSDTTGHRYRAVELRAPSVVAAQLKSALMGGRALPTDREKYERDDLLKASAKVVTISSAKKQNKP